MFRTVLLAGLSAAALTAMPWAKARAQAAVVCLSCPTEIQEVIREATRLGEMGKQLGELKSIVSESQAIYSQANATYQAFTNIRDLGTAVGALQAVGISNPLPISPYAAQALVSGRGGVGGMLGQIGGLFNTVGTGSTVYQCNNGSWMCGAMERFRNGSAGTQALSMQLYSSAADRAPQIQALQAQIATARTPAEREALTAQLTAANAATNNQVVQAIAIQTAGQQEARMQQQQGTERLTEAADEILADARAQGYIR